MKNKALFHLLFILCAVFQPFKAQAQQCEVVPEEIVTLREPVYHTPMVWSATYGGEGLDQIVDSVLAHRKAEEEKGIVIAGNYTSGAEGKILNPFITRLDDRGQVVWETREKSSTMKTVTRLLKTTKGYAVLGDIKSSKKGNGFYIARYSKAGKKLSQRPVYAPSGPLIGKGFVETKDKKAFLIAAELREKKNKGNRIPILFRINKDGTFVWQRKYSPGLNTVFNNIQMLSDGRYMITGEMEQEDGRMAAWLMSVDEAGAIGWQRQYPRGSDSKLDYVQLLEDQTMIVSGTVKPLTGTKKSAWVMKLGSSGTPLWQRYYTGKYRYETKGVIAEEDGRFSVLLNGFPDGRIRKKGEKRSRSHTRLLTLSPRGYLLNVESYTDGQQAQGAKLIEGYDGQRLVSGTIQTTLPDGVSADKLPPAIFDGWIFSATALNSYQDPCIKSY